MPIPPSQYMLVTPQIWCQMILEARLDFCVLPADCLQGLEDSPVPHWTRGVSPSKVSLTDLLRASDASQWSFLLDTLLVSSPDFLNANLKCIVTILHV